MILMNDKVIDKMCNLIKTSLCFNDFKRYLEDFRYEIDFNIFQYGCLDCYDYDLYKRLKDFGVTTKAVTEYEKVLDFGCTSKHREDIRLAYKRLVGRAARRLAWDIRRKKINEDDFIK